MKVEISNGEIYDKITILQIKKRKNAGKNSTIGSDIDAELNELIKIGQPDDELVQRCVAELEKVNGKLWEVEDELRVCEINQDFSDRFVDLARSVYKLNDRRAKLKYEINMLTNSKLVEHKILPSYNTNKE